MDLVNNILYCTYTGIPVKVPIKNRNLHPMTKTTRIVCLCILGAVGTLCGVSNQRTPSTQVSKMIPSCQWGVSQHKQNDSPSLVGIGNDTQHSFLEVSRNHGYRKRYPVMRSRNRCVDLQFSYNLCNLPTQITAENGTTVKYTYFADGAKCWKSATIVQLYSFAFFTASLHPFSCYIGFPMYR